MKALAKIDKYIYYFFTNTKMNASSLLGISFLASLASEIPWTFIFLLTQFIGIRLYSFKDKEDCKRIQKRMNNKCSHTADNGKGFGYSIGFWYFMSISIENSDEGDRYNIWFIATESSYEDLINTKEELPQLDADDNVIEKTDLKIYDRVGTYYNSYYKRRELKIKSITPRPQQEVIMQTIIEHQAIHEHTVAYLYGPPGKGKSLVGILLANAYKGSYCNTMKPWQPGDSISALYSEAEPTKEAPLILVFDEFDTALLRIHEGIEPHKSLPIQVADKTGWNQMLDEIQIGMYPHLILLITSNKPPSFIEALDPSYIREGRVDCRMELP